MNIYIDGLFYRGSGIGRYYESITRGLAEKGNKIFTCIPKRLENEFKKDFQGVAKNINPIFVNYERFSVAGFFALSQVLKDLENEVDVFFFPHSNLPNYVPRATVVTIHDLRPLTEFWDRNYIKRLLMKDLYIKRSVENSQGIICISNVVKNDLMGYFKIPEEKVRVIYEFVESKFAFNNLSSPPIINEPYILFVGNRKKHKNISNLLRAYAFIKDKIPHKIVIAGSKEKNVDEIDELVEKLGIKVRTVEIISPNDEVLFNLYKYADLFVFPSLYEGFGIPPLEAISMSCPVVASNIPILREILGEKIASFDPYDINDIADKVLRAVSDNSYRANLLQKGKDTLKKFDRDKIIYEYISYFEEIKKYG